MKMVYAAILRYAFLFLLGLASSGCYAFTVGDEAFRAQSEAAERSKISVEALGKSLSVGDVVFIRVSAKPFREVAAATGSWTNHVGVVIDVNGGEPVIGESTFPFSRKTRFSKFVSRSENARVAVLRLRTPLSDAQRASVFEAASKRFGIFYDTGFDLHSRREFCSRFVREVIADATGTQLGEIQTFHGLLSSRPDINLGFWKFWYFGNIPWDRETVTPASILESGALETIFDGFTVRSVGI